MSQGGRWALAAVLLGVAISMVAAVATPQRLWLNILANGQLLLGLGLGAGFFVALLYVTGARWGVALRRVPEAITWLLLPGAGLTLAVVFIHPSTWPWFNEAPTGNPALWFREAWLRCGFFQGRAVAYVVLWFGLSALLVRASRKQDRDGRLRWTISARRWSAIYLVVFGITVWLATTDWLMSLEPDWASSAFSVYQFAGIFLSGLAAVTLAVVRLSENGPLHGVITADHLHNLGKLLFAFSVFWAYIWFCQFMLIWYANKPEEIVYFIPRVTGWWRPLFLLNVGINWIIPCCVLLRREPKRRPAVLATVSVLLLAGRWFDLYLHVDLPALGSSPAIGCAEIGPALFAGGLAMLLVTAMFRRAAPVPLRDPLLEQRLARH